MRSVIAMTDPHPMLRASLAGRYDIERELGEGGSGLATVASVVVRLHGNPRYQKIAARVGAIGPN